MKNIWIVLSIILGCSMISVSVVTAVHNNTPTIHSRYMIYGDYSFEVISGPDKNGDINVKIMNTKDSVFTCIQRYNDDVACLRLTCYDLTLSSLMEASQRTMMIHKSSGLIIYPKQASIEHSLKSIILDHPKGEIKVFASASNFFGINN